MAYNVPTFDEIFDDVLTDYKNLNGGVNVEVLLDKLRAYQAENGDVPDISLETLIRCACHASALWGAYKYQEYLSKQPFPDTADTENLEHHGAVQALPRNAGESDADYLARILFDIQNPSAGGNRYDYKQWAEEIEGVAVAYIFSLAQGDGTLDVVVVADETATGSEIPSMSARSGRNTTVTANKLIDMDALFSTGLAVSVGDVVRNTFQGTEARVVTVDSDMELTLDADIFKYAGEHYHVHMHTGTSTSVSASKLVDSAGAFTNATYNIAAGDVVKNLTDDTEATVVSVDGAAQLTLDADIFTAIGKSYVVESLIARVKEHIDDERPVTSSRAEVVAPSILTTAVTMGVIGENVDKVQLKADVEALLNSYIPNQKLYQSQLTNLAVERGAEDGVVSLPGAFPVTPAAYQMIRPGTVTIP